MLEARQNMTGPGTASTDAKSGQFGEGCMETINSPGNAQPPSIKVVSKRGVKVRSSGQGSQNASQLMKPDDL